jgi:hypothetical protein
MIADAIVKLKNIDKNTQVVEIYSQKFRFGKPILTLSSQHANRPVKLITGWDDMPKLELPVTINGGIVKEAVVGSCNLSRGMHISGFGDDTIYVVIAPSML